MRMYASSVVKPAPLVYIRFNGWRVHRRAPTSALGIPRFVDLAQLVARATHLFWCADSSAKENTGRDNSETVNGERTKVRQGSANWRSGKPMFKRIMVGIDGSQAAIGALAEAIRLGESESATVRAVSVVEPEADTITPFSGFGHPVPVARSLRDAAQAGLARACDLFVLTGVTGETSLIDAGDSDVASVLLRESRAWGLTSSFWVLTAAAESNASCSAVPPKRSSGRRLSLYWSFHLRRAYSKASNDS